MDLRKDKISKLVFRLAIPMVIAQLINVLYSTVDKIYIGNMGETGDLALTGIGICFPIIMIITAFSNLIGSGGAPQASIKLGEGNEEAAHKIITNSFVSLICISIMCFTVFYIFKEPILYAFGASDDTINYAVDYLSIYLMGTLFVQITLGLNSFISAQGRANTAMASVVIGAVINIILDPIFIFVFDMGVQGAALATVISQFVSATWILCFILSKQSKLKIKKQYFRLEKKVMIPILALGVSPFVMSATESIVQIAFNASAQKYGGDIMVGCMTILLSVMQLITTPINGFSNGCIPLVAYNYGAKQFDRVKEAVKYMIICCFSLTVVVTSIIMIFSTQVATLFNSSNPELVELAASYIPVFLFGTLFFGLQMACQAAFLGMNQAKISLFIAILRKILLLLTFILIFPIFMDNFGIVFAEAAADVLSVITCVTLFFLNYKKIIEKRKNEVIE